MEGYYHVMLHDAANRKGEKTYIDPKTGYTVQTAHKLLENKKCCGNGCKWCPYNPKHTKGETNVLLEL